MNVHHLQLTTEPFNAILNGHKTIESRLNYHTLHSLFSNNDPAKFGGPSVTWLEDQSNEFYRVGAQREHDVVGIVTKIK